MQTCVLRCRQHPLADLWHCGPGSAYGQAPPLGGTQMRDPPDTGDASRGLRWRGGRVLLPYRRKLVMCLQRRMTHQGRALPCWIICQSLQISEQAPVSKKSESICPDCAPTQLDKSRLSRTVMVPIGRPYLAPFGCASPRNVLQQYLRYHSSPGSAS